MRAVACAACAALIGGCLIVRKDDEPIDEPCPTTQPDLLAAAFGPVAIGDAIYFVGTNQTLSRLSLAGGTPSELTTGEVRPSALALDATDLYAAMDDGTILRWPLDGSRSQPIAEGYSGLTKIVVDDTSVVWASSMGIDRWSKADQTITHLADASVVLGLGASDGRYYYSDTLGDEVRRTPPTEDLAPASYPGPLVVDSRGVYYFDAGDRAGLYSGAIRLIPRDGGTPITTVGELAPVGDIVADDEFLYFVTGYGVVYRIQQVSRFGGTVRTLACGSDSSSHSVLMAIAGDYVYWSDGNGLFRIQRDAISAL